jgi:hypothetical protein
LGRTQVRGRGEWTLGGMLGQFGSSRLFPFLNVFLENHFSVSFLLLFSKFVFVLNQNLFKILFEYFQKKRDREER